jgi:hypothetical protein
MPIKQIVLSEYSRSKEDNLSTYFFLVLNSFNLKNYECYVFYSSPWGDGTDPAELLEIEYQEDLIIWYHWDSLIGNTEFNWYDQKLPYGIEIIKNICLKYPNKKFILVSEQVFYLDDIKNLKIIYFPTMFPRSKTVPYKIINEKKFKDKKWVFLNNHETAHRLVSLSYALFNDLDKHGYITVSNRIIEKSKKYICLNDATNKLFRFDNWDNLDIGFKKLQLLDFEKTNIIPLLPKQSATDQFWNFIIGNYNNNLYKIYKFTAVEIVSGSLFFDNTQFFSEKEQNSVRGKNFPIFLSTAGTAKKWKSYGFDIFEDIINHDYDNIEDPAKRIICAFKDNIHLLNGTANLSKLWHSCQERFEKNCRVLENFQNTLDLNFENQLEQCLSEYNIPLNSFNKSEC